MEFGTVVGEMLYQPVINFETSREPLDWNAQFETSAVQASLAGMRDEASRYFYPTGVQLAGQDQAAAIMEAVNSQDPFDPTDFPDRD
jgi:hypothetical protein